MPNAPTEPPANGTYQHVLQRLHKDPRIEWSFISRSGTVKSRDIIHRGRRLPTFFVTCPYQAKRMFKKGYMDITDEWFEDHPEAASGAQDNERAPAKSKKKRAAATITEPHEAKSRSKKRATAG